MIDTVYLPIHLALRTRSVGLTCQVELLINDRPFATLPVDTVHPAVAEYRSTLALGEALARLFLEAGKVQP